MKSRAYYLTLALALIIIGNSSLVYSIEHPGYSYDSAIKYRDPFWMGSIPDDTRLNKLSIPGTNASFSTGYGGHAYQTQSLSVADQLESGIRFLDIGCYIQSSEHPELFLVSRSVGLGTDLNAAIHMLSGFLEMYPSEAVLVYIHQEYSREADAMFSRYLLNHINSYYSIFWENKKAIQNPTIGEIRGKVLLLHNFPSINFGIQYPSSFNVQDDNYFYTNWDLYDKWLKIKAHIGKASEVNSDEKNSLIFMNWLNGYGGSFPYFVASGHWIPYTGSNQLATILTTPLFSSYYPDFPRPNCWGCAISFRGTNMLATDFITSNHMLRNIGILVADFPGGGLIHAIISVNRRSI